MKDLCEVCRTKHERPGDAEECLRLRMHMVESNLKLHGFKTGKEEKK